MVFFLARNSGRIKGGTGRDNRKAFFCHFFFLVFCLLLYTIESLSHTHAHIAHCLGRFSSADGVPHGQKMMGKDRVRQRRTKKKIIITEQNVSWRDNEPADADCEGPFKTPCRPAKPTSTVSSNSCACIHGDDEVLSALTERVERSVETRLGLHACIADGRVGSLSFFSALSSRPCAPTRSSLCVRNEFARAQTTHAHNTRTSAPSVPGARAAGAQPNHIAREVLQKQQHGGTAEQT